MTLGLTLCLRDFGLHGALLQESVLWVEISVSHGSYTSSKDSDEHEQGEVLQVHVKVLVTHVVWQLDGALVDGGLVDGAFVEGAFVDGALVDGTLVDGTLVECRLDGGLVDGTFVERWLVGARVLV